MKFRSLTMVAAAALAVAACGTKNADMTTLTGKYGENAPEKVRIVASGLDTTINVVNNAFKIDVPNDLTSVAVVSSGNDKVSFIADGSPVTIDFAGDYGVLVPSKAESANARLLAYQKASKAINDEYMAKYTAYETDNKTPVEIKDSLFAIYADSLENVMVELEKKTISENSDNVLAINCLRNASFYYAPSELKDVIATLSPALQETEIVKSLVSSIDAKLGTAEGGMFKDFEVTQPDGTVAKLSDYVGKGKYILVDFWASWCGPCRAEIPNIKAVYDKYHGDKFDIVSVAVWDKVEDTQKAISEEGLKWNQIVDALKVPTDLYGIDGIPHIILFGPDGTIIKRGLRGDDIEKTVAEYVK